MTKDFESERIGWIEVRLCRLVFEPQKRDPEWLPGMAFFLFRRLHRKRLFLLRWDWWFNLLFIASLIFTVWRPWLIFYLLLGPILGLIAMEYQVSSTARRCLRSNFFEDLVLTGYNYRTLRTDIEAFAISRSPFVHLFSLYVVLGLFVFAGVLGAMQAFSIFHSQGFAFPVRKIIQHGADRGFGLGSPISQAFFSFIFCMMLIGIYILMLASPLLLFFLVYISTGSAVAGLVVLIIAIHALIILIAVRSGKAKPFGELASDTGKSLQKIFDPPELSDEQIHDLLINRDQKGIIASLDTLGS